VATGCNFECKDPPTDAPRLYDKIVAGLQKVPRPANTTTTTKTEAVLRYVDLPILKRFVQFVTPLSNPGSKKPEEKDVMIDVHPEGEHGEEKTEEQDQALTHWEDAKEEGS
jgi:hypothetical protein